MSIYGIAATSSLIILVPRHRGECNVAKSRTPLARLNLHRRDKDEKASKHKLLVLDTGPSLVDLFCLRLNC